MNKTRIRFYLVTAALLLAAACGKPNDAAYYNRGGPEMLLDVSNEVVNLSVASAPERAQLSSWIEQDAPTRAELYCTAGNKGCDEARNLLELHGVPTMVVPSMDYSVALVYERILARDCNQRFVDNHNNNWNAPHPTLGCSISANMVQHVSDKQEFVNPNLTDPVRATQAVNAYERSLLPAEPVDIGKSVVQTSTTE